MSVTCPAQRFQRRIGVALCAAIFVVLTPDAVLEAQQKPPAPRVERLDRERVRIGAVVINTARRELTVPGIINSGVTVLEFIANTPRGVKAYESVLTLEADAFTFNAALLLMGLDASRARRPTQHFDLTQPDGDRVEITVEWNTPAGTRRAPIDDLLFSKETNTTVPRSEWVYTGSTVVGDGQYLADLDGVLIGFVHSPAPIIESVTGAGIGRYGSIVLNPNLGLEPETKVTLTVRALPMTR
jgi:hypothetical protein